MLIFLLNRAGKTLIILADGMGGHRAGNIASEMAVTDLGAAWVDTQIDSVNQVREWFAEHLEEENQRIHQFGQDEEYKGMGHELWKPWLSLIIKPSMPIL